MNLVYELCNKNAAAAAEYIRYNLSEFGNVTNNHYVGQILKV